MKQSLTMAELELRCCLTGYFRNAERIELMMDTIEKLPESTQVFVDPIGG